MCVNSLKALMDLLVVLPNVFVEVHNYTRQEEGNLGTVSILYVHMMDLHWLIW